MFSIQTSKQKIGYSDFLNQDFSLISSSFSPKSLFSAGEQGAWYDPSDLSTMYQDYLGTTPVTGVEQSVGRIMDKSKGLVIGSELVTNGDFSNGTTGWTANDSNLSIVSGKLRVQTIVDYGRAIQTVSAVLGKTYRITADVTATESTQVDFSSDLVAGSGGSVGVGSSIATGNRTASFLWTPPSTGSFAIRLQHNGASSGYADFDNVSIKEVSGNHAYQSTSTKRPILSARYNLLTTTEFPNGASDLSVRSGLATMSTLSGYSNAVAFGWDGSTGSAAYKTYTFIGLTSYRMSVVVKMDDGNIPVFGSDTTTSILNDFAIVIASAGVKPTSIVSLGSGYYRVSTTYTTIASPSTNVGVIKYGGNSNRTFKVTAFDLRIANDGSGIPTYQRVNTSTDYDTVGFPKYLKFDGVDDSLVTPSINFTATDKMTVFSGIRKESDATFASLIELGDGTNTNRFALYAPRYNASASYGFLSGGSILVSSISSTIFPAPITNIVSCIGDIANDICTQRENGVVNGTSSADQGTGAYGNYPLNIGSRNNANSYFNGRIYGLIVRGATSTATQITKAEKYINLLTKAY